MSNDDAHLLIGRALGLTIRRENKTEPYVCIPPALWITDSDGTVYTAGTAMNNRFEFEVIQNDKQTGEFASKIEYKDGLVRIFGGGRWKSLSRNRRTFI